MHRNCLLVAVCGTVLLFAVSCTRQAKQDAIPTFKMGEKIELGHLHYTVFDARWVTQLPGTPTPRLPQGRFLVVVLSTMNGGGENMMLPNLSIEDETGKSYQELSDGSGVPNWSGYLRKAVPAEAVQGTIVFDAPPKTYKLRLTDESGENAAFVELPMTIGTDGNTASTPLSTKTQ